MNDDHDTIDRAGLIAKAEKLRTSIQRYSDTTRHDLRWYDPHLWSLMPDMADANLAVPPWPKFLHVCVQYGQVFDAQTNCAGSRLSSSG